MQLELHFVEFFVGSDYKTLVELTLAINQIFTSACQTTSQMSVFGICLVSNDHLAEAVIFGAVLRLS